MKIDQLIRTRRKTIALIVEHDGRLIVRAPLRFSLARLQEIVNQRSEWIKKKREQIKNAYPGTSHKRYIDGENFWYLGKSYPLEIIPTARLSLVLNQKFYLARTALPKARTVFIAWYKEQTREILSERVQWYAARHGFTYHQIRVSSARTRWGSCSPRGTLSFTWRLVMAPMPVIDYVVVHELVHLHEKNHSKHFWAEVKAIMPDYQQYRDWLKTKGRLLNLE